MASRYARDDRSKSPRCISPDRHHRTPQYRDGDRRRPSADEVYNNSIFPRGRDPFGDLLHRQPLQGPGELADLPSVPRGGNVVGRHGPTNCRRESYPRSRSLEDRRGRDRGDRHQSYETTRLNREQLRHALGDDRDPHSPIKLEDRRDASPDRPPLYEKTASHSQVSTPLSTQNNTPQLSSQLITQPAINTQPIQPVSATVQYETKAVTSGFTAINHSPKNKSTVVSSRFTAINSNPQSNVAKSESLGLATIRNGPRYDQSRAVSSELVMVNDDSKISNEGMPNLDGILNPPVPMWIQRHPSKIELAPVANKFYCSICGKWLRTKSELNKHDRRHSRPFHCDVQGCTRKDGFANQNDLDRHKTSVHLDRSLAKTLYICHLDRCSHQTRPKVWPRADNFRSHLRRMHNKHYSVDDDLDQYIYRDPQAASKGSVRAIPSTKPTQSPPIQALSGFTPSSVNSGGTDPHTPMALLSPKTPASASTSAADSDEKSIPESHFLEIQDDA